LAVHTVSEVNNFIKRCFESVGDFKNLTIQGEISNFKRQYSGHCYFSLKEGNSVLKCAMFQGSAKSLKFRPQDGMQVLATGYIGVYEQGGVYQLYVHRMVPEGIGELALAFEELKNKLAKEGLFAEEHKKPLPRFPKVIGVVTSATGAVLRDIYRVSKRRDPYSRIVLYPAQVQGEGSAEQIAEGIEFFNNEYPVDVLIAGRGGGSAEDLWCFNEEIVVRAIYNSRIPVISAVGHETDFTLADFAADMRAATPSQAAELATPDIRAWINTVQEWKYRLDNSVRKSMNYKRQLLKSLVESPALRYPERMLENRQQKLDNLMERLENSADFSMKEKHQKLGRLLDKLELMNPLGILRRGYSMTTDQAGRIIKSVESVQQNDEIKVILPDGAIKAVVQEISVEEVR
jgi:exodeoxyribonuclease VII large subunit